MQPLLNVENLVKRYDGKRLVALQDELSALDGVSFSLFPATTLAVVGPSGSGKSTLALCLACLEPVTSGKIWFAQTEVTAMNAEQQRAIRPSIQMVFQDPASSLNPRMIALELVLEPLNIQIRF